MISLRTIGLFFTNGCGAWMLSTTLNFSVVENSWIKGWRIDSCSKRTKSCAVETFCGERPSGSMKWVCAIPSSFVFRFIAATKASAPPTYDLARALIALFSDDIKPTLKTLFRLISAPTLSFHFALDCQAISSRSILSGSARPWPDSKTTIEATYLDIEAIGEMAEEFLSTNTSPLSTSTT